MAIKKDKSAMLVTSLTLSHSQQKSHPSPDNGAMVTRNKPHDSSAFKRLCRKLSPRRTAEDETKSPLSRYSDGEVQCNQLEHVFRFFDKDGDGKISAEELRRCIEKVGGELSEEEAEMVVRTSDTNGDGMLGLDDFGNLMEGCGDKERVGELKEAFDMYAMKDTGYITPKSLKRMLCRLGNSTTVQNCKTMISKFDLNGDGVLSFDEFKIMMSSS